MASLSRILAPDETSPDLAVRSPPDTVSTSAHSIPVLTDTSYSTFTSPPLASTDTSSNVRLPDAYIPDEVSPRLAFSSIRAEAEAFRVSEPAPSLMVRLPPLYMAAEISLRENCVRSSVENSPLTLTEFSPSRTMVRSFSAYMP